VIRRRRRGSPVSFDARYHPGPLIEPGQQAPDFELPDEDRTRGQGSRITADGTPSSSTSIRRADNARTLTNNSLPHLKSVRQ